MKISVKKLVLFLVSLMLIGLFVGVVSMQFRTPAKVVHFHAGFQVYKDNELANFSKLAFMHLEPCTLQNKNSKKHEDEQEAKAHLHDLVGDVVHVHREGARWKDLFSNMKYRIDMSKPVEGYRNGVRVADILTQPIRPYESVIIFIGQHDAIPRYLTNAVTKKHIQEVEVRSENCGS